MTDTRLPSPSHTLNGGKTISQIIDLYDIGNQTT